MRGEIGVAGAEGLEVLCFQHNLGPNEAQQRIGVPEVRPQVANGANRPTRFTHIVGVLLTRPCTNGDGFLRKVFALYLNTSLEVLDQLKDIHVYTI